MSLPDTIQRAADLIRKSKEIVVLTGAGISTHSGIPDFRSSGNGLWTRSDPMEVASYSAFRYRPEIFFNWLRPLATKILNASPNAAHHSLAALEQAGFIRAVITQNIDGLHQKAGSMEVIEVHGSLTRMVCQGCEVDYPAEGFHQQLIEGSSLPRCAKCGSVLKPGIVLFEEMLPTDAWCKAEDYSTNADLFIVIGSSLQVTPAAGLPISALHNGAKLIINTLSPTYLDGKAELVISADVTQVVPEIARLMLGV